MHINSVGIISEPGKVVNACKKLPSWLPLQGNVINLTFLVGANAHIGPKGLIFNPFGTIEKGQNWLFPLRETLTPVRLRADVGIGPYGEIFLG